MSSTENSSETGRDALHVAIDPTPTGRSLELDSLKIEYQNLFDRSNKLDNKVYIAITFCGFLFVFITGLFSGISSLRMPSRTAEYVLTAIYIFFCIALIVAYVLVLIYLMRMLEPEHIVRLDPAVIEEEQLGTVNSQEATRRLIVLYRGIINENLEKLQIRCESFVHGIRYVCVTVVLAFAAYILQVVLNLI